ncbi:MAG TPA: amidohydrolase family protein [Candidatus Aquilonibacter sp.]|nr:amidohydrolase family protein [Candidatus Aquilonibacter sp.]
MPLIVDAFYYGSDLAHQPSLPGIIAIAQDSPERPVIVAHCGGYRLLEYFFHLRDLPNIWYDLSFSLQYLSDSSLRSDLIKLIRYTSPDRLMFGSDFPFASAARQCDVLIGLAREAGVRDDGLDRMLATNARDLFGGVIA